MRESFTVTFNRAVRSMGYSRPPTKPPEPFDTKWVYVTPALAEWFLDYHNSKNRRISTYALQALVHDCNNGGLFPMPVPIVIDRNGQIADGQTRLKAVEASGKSQWLWFCFNADPKTRMHFDQNRVRPSSICLDLAGKGGLFHGLDPARAESIARAFIAAPAGKAGRIGSRELERILTTYKREIGPALELCALLPKVPSVTRAMVYALHGRAIPYVKDQKKLEDFTVATITGEYNGAANGRHCRLFRERLMQLDKSNNNINQTVYWDGCKYLLGFLGKGSGRRRPGVDPFPLQS